MKKLFLLGTLIICSAAVPFTPDNQSIVLDSNQVAHTGIPFRVVTTSTTIAASDLAGVVNFNGNNLTATIPRLPGISTVVVCNYNATPLNLSPAAPIKGYSASTLPGLNNGAASCLNLTSDGTQWWAMVFIPGGATAPAGDTLVLQMSEDPWQGDAAFNVTLDGTRLNPIPLTVTAVHSQGATQSFPFTGSWGPGPHTLGIEFLNDAFGGPGMDRNLYLNSATYDGVTVPGSLNLFSGGVQTLPIP